MASFAERFLELREERGWTQEQAAEVFGVQRPTVAGWENNSKQRVPRRETLLNIAQKFGVSTDFLLGNTNERQTVAPQEDQENQRVTRPDTESWMDKLAAEYEEKNGHQLPEWKKKAILSVVYGQE